MGKGETRDLAPGSPLYTSRLHHAGPIKCEKPTLRAALRVITKAWVFFFFFESRLEHILSLVLLA